MLRSIIIGLVAFLVIASVASAQGWQPSWAPQPIPLIQGQEYRSGSPLSRPGFLGLLGGLANGVTGGAMPDLTGGGSEIWQGETQGCAGVEVNGVCMKTFTPEEARAAQEGIDWSNIENQERVVIPTCTDGQRIFVTMTPDAELGARLIYSCQ